MGLYDEVNWVNWEANKVRLIDDEGNEIGRTDDVG